MWYTNMADSNSCYASGHMGEKTLLRFYSFCHDMKISLVSNRTVASAAGDLVPTSKNLYLLQ